jgi:hypothetical protein
MDDCRRQSRRQRRPPAFPNRQLHKLPGKILVEQCRGGIFAGTIGSPLPGCETGQHQIQTKDELGVVERSRGIRLGSLALEGLDRFDGGLGIRARLNGLVKDVDGLLILGISQRNGDAPKNHDMHMGRSRSR